VTDSNNLYIVNTRSGNPNALVAVPSQSSGGYTPQLLVVNGKNTEFNTWNIVQSSGQPGCYHIQYISPDNVTYYLAMPALPKNPKEPTGCELVPASQYPSDSYCGLWVFPFDTRLLSAWGANASDQGLPSQYSLDAGNYPSLITLQFISSVNQTWQFGKNVNGPYQKNPFIG
jgi:hypothetical protein